MARQRESSCTAKRLRLHNLWIGKTGSRIIERLYDSGWQWCKLRQLLFQNLIKTYQGQRGKLVIPFSSPFVCCFTHTHTQSEKYIFSSSNFISFSSEGGSHSVDHCWFKLCGSNITEIGCKKNGFCWCFAWQIDSWWIGKNHEWLIRWCCLCG